MQFSLHSQLMKCNGNLLSAENRCGVNQLLPIKCFYRSTLYNFMNTNFLKGALNLKII